MAQRYKLDDLILEVEKSNVMNRQVIKWPRIRTVLSKNIGHQFGNRIVRYLLYEDLI